jgi:hypothetical protein
LTTTFSGFDALRRHGRDCRGDRGGVGATGASGVDDTGKALAKAREPEGAIIMDADNSVAGHMAIIAAPQDEILGPSRTCTGGQIPGQYG